MLSKKKIIIIGSTNGSVLSKVLNQDIYHRFFHSVEADRSCGILDVAKKHHIGHALKLTSNSEDFCNYLIKKYIDKKDDIIFISFYTKLFNEKFVNTFEGSIYNFHPTLLPSYPGLNGDLNSIESSTKFLGSTIHHVDNGIDTGQIIMQACFQNLDHESFQIKRHKIFLSQFLLFKNFLNTFYFNAAEEKSKLIMNDTEYFFSPSFQSCNNKVDL